MATKIIREVFEAECGNLAIDPKLIKLLQAYNTRFVNKNTDHISFFGGNLTGVEVVRFTDTDRDSWFDDILKTDEAVLENELYKLPSIDSDHHVASDVMNLSCVWLAHAILNSKLLSADQKKNGMECVFLILQYKFITSRLFRHFKFPANKATAEATYAQLSNKFAIKQYGNWSAVLGARAEDIIDKDSIHYHTLLKMDSDKGVIYVLSDTQGRIRGMLKGIYNIFLQVHNQNQRIVSISSTVEHDGEEMLRDKTKSALAYERYLNSIVTDQNSFIREELMNIIEKLMKTMSPKLFRETLVWISRNYRQTGAEEIELVLNETIIHSLDYFSHHRNLIRNTSDLPELLSNLRGVYMSSRSTDPALFSLRDKTAVIIFKATANKNESQIAAVRTGVLLYLVLRAMTMRYYTQ